MNDVLRSLTREQAQKYIGDLFQIRFDDGTTIDLTLEHVQFLTDKHLNPRMKRDAFSLQFRGPANVQLRQSIYPMHHDELGGPLPIFIVPIGVQSNGFLYEAVFN